MQNTEKTDHFGRWLERTIQDRGRSVNAFGKSIGVAEPTIYAWVRSAKPRIHRHNLSRLAKALGINREEIEAKLAEAEGLQPGMANVA